MKIKQRITSNTKEENGRRQGDGSTVLGKTVEPSLCLRFACIVPMCYNTTEYV